MCWPTDGNHTWHGCNTVVLEIGQRINIELEKNSVLLGSPGLYLNDITNVRSVLICCILSDSQCPLSPCYPWPKLIFMVGTICLSIHQCQQFKAHDISCTQLLFGTVNGPTIIINSTYLVLCYFKEQSMMNLMQSSPWYRWVIARKT